ncbi:hypothetical protein BGP_5885 [Beggiatoa sp. PS]|nr:hypothetical protein BGP_5885 [Beggiatoa sp. PS]
MKSRIKLFGSIVRNMSYSEHFNCRIWCIKISQANKNKQISAHNFVNSSNDKRNTIFDGNRASITTIMPKK